MVAAPRRFEPLAQPYGVAFAPLDDSVFALQDDLAGKGTRAAITTVGAVRPLMRRWLEDVAALGDIEADVVVYAPKTHLWIVGVSFLATIFRHPTGPHSRHGRLDCCR